MKRYVFENLTVKSATYAFLRCDDFHILPKVLISSYFSLEIFSTNKLPDDALKIIAFKLNIQN